jgi:hypothetical protein
MNASAAARWRSDQGNREMGVVLCDPTPRDPPDRLHRRDLLGGLIDEYEAAA